MKAKKSDENYFDKAAASWDDNPIRAELACSVCEKIIAEIPLRKTMRALEFGCGTGVLAMMLASRLDSIVAIDNSSQMLDVLNRKIMKGGCDNISTYQMDITKDSFPGTKFDFIFSCMSFHHIEDVEALLLLFKESLNPYGYVAIADLDKEDGSFHGDIPGVFHYGFDRDEFRQCFETAGFVNIKNTIAHILNKKNEHGTETGFPVFLMAGQKPLPVDNPKHAERI